jgi:hypothetical protein
MKRLELSTFCMASGLRVRVSCGANPHRYMERGADGDSFSGCRLPFVSGGFVAVWALAAVLCPFAPYDRRVDEALEYEGMLSALQGLLGQKVAVIVEVRYAGRLRPLVALKGVLRSGLTDELSELGGPQLNYPGGEAILFSVGSEHSWFVVRRDDFKHGRREGKALLFETGRSQTYISPFPPR